MTKINFAFLDALTRIAELKIEQLFNGIGMISVLKDFFYVKRFYRTYC